MEDKLIGILIGIARATEGNEDKITKETDRIIIEGLANTSAGVSSDNKILEALIERAENEKRKLIPLCYECACPCGRNDNYNMQDLWNAKEDGRSLRIQILSEIREIAVRMYCGEDIECEVNPFFYEALFAVGMDDFGGQELLPIVTKTRAIRRNYKSI